MTTIIENKLFSIEESHQAYYLSFLQPKLGKGERMKIALEGDNNLLETCRPMSDEEYNNIGYTKLGKKPYWINATYKGEKYSFPFAAYLSQTDMYEAGLFPVLSTLQRILANPYFLEFLKDAESTRSLADHLKRRGTAFDLSFTCETGNGPSCIGLGKSVREEYKEGYGTIQEVNCLLAIVYTKCLKLAGMDRNNLAEWVAKASVTMGYEGNTAMTSVQINISPPTKPLGDALGGGRGDTHPDGGDDPRALTVALNLSNLGPEHFPGRFQILNTKLACEMLLFSALLLTARHPHRGCATGTYPDDFPKHLRWQETSQVIYPILPSDWPKQRILLPCYSHLQLIRAKPEMISEELFTAPAVVAFGTVRNWREWMMRYDVKVNHKTLNLNVDELRQKFAWTDDAEQPQLPSPKIAQLCLEMAGSDFADGPEFSLGMLFHAAALSVDCGWRKLKDENEDEKNEDGESEDEENGKASGSKKIRKKIVDENGEKVKAVKCHFFIKRTNERCKSDFLPTKNNQTRCHIHVGEEGRDVNTRE